MFVILFRNNGIYVVLPTAIALAIVKLSAGLKSMVKTGTILLIPIIICIMFDHFAVPAMGFRHGSLAEVLSIPAQQTARLMRDYPEDITDEDKEHINALFDYDNLVSLYDPDISDPVKSTYKGGNAGMHLNYIKTWLKGLKEHPGVYIQATMNTCYPAFYPEVNNSMYWVNREEATEYIHLKQNNIFISTRNKLENILRVVDSLPLVGILSNPAMYVWLMIIFICEIFKKKQYNLIAAVMPFVMTAAIIIAGPCVLKHPRYVYPIMWPMYLYAACVLSKI